MDINEKSQGLPGEVSLGPGFGDTGRVHQDEAVKGTQAQGQVCAEAQQAERAEAARAMVSSGGSEAVVSSVGGSMVIPA